MTELETLAAAYDIRPSFLAAAYKALGPRSQSLASWMNDRLEERQAPAIKVATTPTTKMVGMIPYWEPGKPGTQRWDADVKAWRCYLPGCFSAVLKNPTGVVCLLDHDHDCELASVQAGTLRLWDDKHGLHYEASIKPETAKVLRDLITRGKLGGSSMGYAEYRGPISEDPWAFAGGRDDKVIVWQVVGLQHVGPVAKPAFAASTVAIA